MLLLTSVIGFDTMILSVDCCWMASLEGVVFYHVICVFRDFGVSCFDFGIYSYFI